MRKKIVLVFFVFLQLFGLLFTQEAKIIWERIDGTEVKKAVEFIDNNNKLLKSINLANENPYNHLDYEIELTTIRGTKYYKSVPYDDIFSDKTDFNLDKIKDTEFVLGISNCNVYVMKKYVFISYSLGTRSGPVYTGSLSTLKLYSNDGILIKEYVDLENIGGFRITEDGKYMLCSYGNDMGDESAIKESMGVRIFDFENNNLLIDRKFNTGFIPNNHYAKGNLLIISSTKYGEVEKEDKLEIVHFRDRKIYTLIMPRSENLRRKEITEEGFTFRNIDITKDDIQLFYRKDFISEEF